MTMFARLARWHRGCEVRHPVLTSVITGLALAFAAVPISALFIRWMNRCMTHIVGGPILPTF